MQITAMTECHINRILCDHSPQRGSALYEEMGKWNKTTDDGTVTEHTQPVPRFLPT
jgi:hypothetical protein